MFDEFWQAYPRKVAKKAARKEYEKALREVDHETIMKGVEAYKRNKPGYADWCHPRTWLCQGRWEDDYPAEHPEVVAQKTQDLEEHRLQMFMTEVANVRKLAQRCRDLGVVPLDEEAQIAQLRAKWKIAENASVLRAV